MKTDKAGCAHCGGPDLGRRYFLRAGSLGLLGIGLRQFFELESQLAAAEVSEARKKAKAQACILLWQEGGVSHRDTWDWKPESAFKPIPTNVAGIQVSELLPRVAKHMDKLGVIRSMHTEETNHSQAIHYAVTGHRPSAAMRFPSLGSIVAREMGVRNNVPPYVFEPELGREPQIMGYMKASFAGAEYDPMVLGDPSAKDFEVPDLILPKSISTERIADRRSFLKVVDDLYRRRVESAEHAKLDSFTDQALKMLLTPSVKEAFDLSKESEKTKEAYGNHRFGQSVLLARRLVEAGSRFVTAAGYKHIAWDTHADNDRRLREDLTPPFDQAFSALLEDLEQRGLLESTVVIAMGEFGRTLKNPNHGRDHWPKCWSLVIGGGGIRGGQVVGASDAKGLYVADRQVTMGDVYATIYKAFGIDWEKTYMSPIGRPVKIANSIDDATGVPVHELV
jgi:hypothetical protein